MKTMKFAWLLFVLGFWIAPANAESMVASGLLNFCNAVVHPETMRNPQMEPLFRGQCMGYMSGWRGGVDGVLITDEKGFMQNISIEDGVTSQQMGKVFVLYMENHPEEENKPAQVAVMHAMTNAGLVTLESPGKDKTK